MLRKCKTQSQGAVCASTLNFMFLGYTIPKYWLVVFFVCHFLSFIHLCFWLLLTYVYLGKPILFENAFFYYHTAQQETHPFGCQLRCIIYILSRACMQHKGKCTHSWIFDLFAMHCYVATANKVRIICITNMISVHFLATLLCLHWICVSILEIWDLIRSMSDCCTHEWCKNLSQIFLCVCTYVCVCFIAKIPHFSTRESG